MIKQAILAHGIEARLGLGRPTIKKFILGSHPDTGRLPLASFNAHFNQAIARGESKGVFTLPKGMSGKVRLSSKSKASVKKAAPQVRVSTYQTAKPVKKASSAAKVCTAYLPDRPKDGIEEVAGEESYVDGEETRGESQGTCNHLPDPDCKGSQGRGQGQGSDGG